MAASDNVAIPKTAIITALMAAVGFGGYIVKNQHSNSTRMEVQAAEIRNIGNQLEKLAQAGPRYTKEMAEKDNTLQARELDAKFEKTLREAMLPISISMNQMEGKMSMVVDVLNQIHKERS